MKKAVKRDNPVQRRPQTTARATRDPPAEAELANAKGPALAALHGAALTDAETVQNNEGQRTRKAEQTGHTRAHARASRTQTCVRVHARHTCTHTAHTRSSHSRADSYTPMTPLAGPRSPSGHHLLEPSPLLCPSQASSTVPLGSRPLPTTLTPPCP